MEKKKVTRKEQAQQTKARIYACALELAAIKSYDQITINEICKNAGVSVGNFYHYFNDKAEVYRVVGEGMTESLEQSILASDANLNHQEAISYLFRLISESHISIGANITKCLLSQAMQKVDFYDPSGSFNPMDILAVCIKSGIESGEFKSQWNAEEVAFHLMTSYRGLTTLWSFNPDTINLLEATEKFTEIELAGIMA